MEGHNRSVISVAISPNSRYAASGSEDNTIRLWELETGQCLRTLEGHTNTVKTVSISPDNRHVVSGSWDNTIKVWEFIWDLEFDE